MAAHLAVTEILAGSNPATCIAGERRSWRVGRDCKSRVLWLSGFESHLSHYGLLEELESDHKHGAVEQLVSSSACHAEDCEFESRRFR